MLESAAPVYPAIARAAHVQGPVVLLVSFKATGEVDTITVVTGPELLRQSAVTFVHGWRANPFTGSRTCPIGLEYHLQNPGDKEVPFFVRKDPQYGTVNSGVPIVIALPSQYQPLSKVTWGHHRSSHHRLHPTHQHLLGIASPCDEDRRLGRPILPALQPPNT
jgi:hypothetical protein